MTYLPHRLSRPSYRPVRFPPMARPLPKKDHKIAPHEAARLIKAHRHKAAATSTSAAPVLCFHRQAFERILKQPGCSGIRLYPALHDDGSQTLVLVGINAEGCDMHEGEFAQDPVECPPDCDPTSPLVT